MFKRIMRNGEMKINRNCPFNITRESSNNTMTKTGATLEPGEYKFYVFDINKNKSLASLPAFTSTTVIVMATSFSSMATTSRVPTPTPSATTSVTTSTGSPAGMCGL